MSNLEEQRDEYRSDDTPELLIKATTETLNKLDIVNDQAEGLLSFVYDNWDTYDILCQQSLPQLDYEKTLRLASLSRNTLERLLDQFAELDTDEILDRDCRDMIKRAKHTMRALTNAYNKAGIPFTPIEIQRAA